MKLKTEFQDEDFRKGEVADVSIATIPDGRIVARAKAESGGEHIFYYNCIETLCNDWSDYEEPKGSALDSMILTLTNFIENEPDEDKVDLEDCKQMLEKLKAWKRLKDKGFSIYSWDYEFDMVDKPAQTIILRASAIDNSNTDLDICFGGEE